MVALNIASVIIYAVLYRKSAATDQFEPENVKYKTIMRNEGAVFVLVSLYWSDFVCSYKFAAKTHMPACGMKATSL